MLDRVEENYAAPLDKYGGARGHCDRVKERVQSLREGKPITNGMM